MKSLLIGWLLLVSLPVMAADYRNPSQVQMRADEAPADTWQTLPLSRVDPQQRLIWVRLRFVLPASAISPRRPLGMYIAVPAAYEAWWNGTYIGRNGTPGRSKTEEVPGRLDSALLIPSGLLRPGENELLLRMSSFHLPGRLSTPMQAIELREFGVPSPGRLLQNSFRMMAAGALLLGAVYFGALYFSNRKERSSLLLALLSLSVLGQLGAESIRFFVRYSYPFHLVRLELILALAATSALLLVMYVADRYARSQQRALLASMVLLGIACVAVLPGFDRKTFWILIAGFLVSSVAAGTGLRRKVRGAGLATLAIIATLVLAGADLYQFIDRTYYLAIVALLFMLFGQHVIALRRAQRVQAETQLRSARLELELLRQQIQPHFLMNTLTALCEWIESDPAVGVKMIEALGDELRAIVVMGEAITVPLGQELDLCRHHLRVMGFRRNQRFTLTAQGLNLDAPIPPALFHTLIENALTHNRYADGVEFVLSGGAAANGRCRYELRSPLHGSARSKGTGKGHAYVRARLRHAFGDNWHFSSEPAADREWVDSVEVPKR